ncbi:hypothetical protein NFIA_017200 [Paecilomyces variotii No. 5]|uniref:SWIM-type domain-containing protein n=1 Tax=Byssochlamys spectabilis (strain No. 5 / NBRC 109023) TaxID=1356009 RepID=V5I2V1_BYSSN|nr:hypothetical protein NFIA_017200 [Paecilomyces variotii No. 5]
MESPAQSHDIPSISRLIERLIAELSTIPSPEPQNTTTGARTTAWTQSTQPDIQNQNLFSSLRGSHLSKVKSLMLTLHCLFPDELLLALDILDRRLVRRFVSVKDAGEDQNRDHHGDATATPAPMSHGREEIPDSEDEDEEEQFDLQPEPEPEPEPEPNQVRDDEMFLVLSTSSTTTESSRRIPEKYYEVRLQAWNCTCAAFVLSTFRNPGQLVEEDPGVREDEDEGLDGHHEDRWLGGTLTRLLSRNSAPPMCKHLLACVLATRCRELFGNGLQERIDVSQSEMAGWAAGWGG